MPALVTVPNIEIVRTGEWKPNTTDGRPWVVTPADIAGAVEASKNGSFRAPVVKLGHADPRFTAGKQEMFGRDGTPGVGRLVNLRASQDGNSLIADIEGMPQWLAEAMPSAYPSRSVDALLGAVAGDGKVYPLVITHLALLGETVPAIESLADVAALYGHHDTDVGDWLAASTVAARQCVAASSVSDAEAEEDRLYAQLFGWSTASPGPGRQAADSIPADMRQQRGAAEAAAQPEEDRAYAELFGWR